MSERHHLEGNSVSFGIGIEIDLDKTSLKYSKELTLHARQYPMSE